MFPAAVKERSKEEEEVRGVREEVKKLLEQLRMGIKESRGDQGDSLYVTAERQRKKTSWNTSE